MLNYWRLTSWHHSVCCSAHFSEARVQLCYKTCLWYIVCLLENGYDCICNPVKNMYSQSSHVLHYTIIAITVQACTMIPTML